MDWYRPILPEVMRGPKLSESIVVGIGDIKCSHRPETLLIAPDLGSGVCVCAFDPQERIAAVAHVALPASSDGDTAVGRFADTAIPALVEQMVAAGSSPDRIRVALVGGSDLAAFRGNGARIELGARNIAAVKAELDTANLAIVAADVGGTDGRTLLLTADGRVCVKAAGKREREIANLGFSGGYQTRSQ
jgi:chemotaxis protein CheD